MSKTVEVDVAVMGSGVAVWELLTNWQMQMD